MELMAAVYIFFVFYLTYIPCMYMNRKKILVLFCSLDIYSFYLIVLFLKRVCPAWAMSLVVNFQSIHA